MVVMVDLASLCSSVTDMASLNQKTCFDRTASTEKLPLQSLNTVT